jgi:hypothetical protein
MRCFIMRFEFSPQWFWRRVDSSVGVKVSEEHTVCIFRASALSLNDP